MKTPSDDSVYILGCLDKANKLHRNQKQCYNNKIGNN